MLSADEVYAHADELQDAMEETVSNMTGIRNRMKPIIDRVKGRRITEDDLFECAQDAEDLADELGYLVVELRDAVAEVERVHFGDDDEEAEEEAEEGGGRFFGML
jgi:hypothetical protein